MRKRIYTVRSPQDDRRMTELATKLWMNGNLNEHLNERS